MNNLRQIRLGKNATLKEAADSVGIDPGNLSRIERGKQRVTVDLAPRLAGYYGISEVEILYPERSVATSLPSLEIAEASA